MKVRVASYLLPLMLLTLASCAEQYMVQGSTSLQEQEGEMMYLKVLTRDEMKNIDSCRVTHGKFEFRGPMDSVVVANLFSSDQSMMMPVVLEAGDLKLNIDQTVQDVSGGELNEKLFKFLSRKRQLDSQLAELPQREGRMVMDGVDHDQVVAQLDAEAMQILQQQDQLVTDFIRKNYSNVLGPWLFMMITNDMAYPVMVPQIEEIITNATPYFLNHPYVSEWLKIARENSEILQTP